MSVAPGVDSGSGLQAPRGGDLMVHLLRASSDAPVQDTVFDWWPRATAEFARWPTPIARAIAGGFASDRMAWAFCSGYQAALRALVPDLSNDQVAALCATEKNGNHPRAIQTTLCVEGGGFLLSGHKVWTTLGPESGIFLIVARRAASPVISAESIGATPQLVVVRVAGGVPGLTLRTMPATRFVPEAPHAQVVMESVRVSADQILHGDGYERYLKPFRTIEDIYVQAAIIAWLVREARARSWPRPLVERGMALIESMIALSQRDVAAPATHIILAGTLALSADWIEQCHAQWLLVLDDDAGKVRWLRDRSLFGVAQTPRELRLSRAWERVLA